MIYAEDNIQEAVEKLKIWMAESNYTVVLTGAGMDTESNIPDFRGRDGWWKQYDPRILASIDNFHRDYPLFQEFYSMRIKLLEGIKPHSGHYILAELENKGLIDSVATQNVSKLHFLAGSKNVYELHGNIQTVSCNNCRSRGKVEEFLEGKNCSKCGKLLRPNVVLFGEGLPMEAWTLAEKDIRNSDLLIVLGTSLEVSPVNQLPLIAGGKTVLINNEDVGRNYDFDMRLIGSAGEILEGLL